jgi:hypothetical protein
VSSRLVVLCVPFVVIAIFWWMARREAKLRHDPTHKSYFERNGMVLGIGFIAMVAPCCPISTWWWKASTRPCGRWSAAARSTS